MVASGLSSGEAYCQTLLQAAKLVSRGALAGASFGYVSEPQPLHRRFKRIMRAGFTPNPKLALGGFLLAACLGLVSLPGIQPSAFRGPSLYPCEPSPEIRQALSSLIDRYDFSVPREECLRPLRAMAEKFPYDLFVQIRLQDTFRGNITLYPEFDRAFAQYRSRPNDPVFQYLEARLTASFNAKKAEELYNALIAKEPAFPWPHLAIAELACLVHCGTQDGTSQATRTEGRVYRAARGF